MRSRALLAALLSLVLAGCSSSAKGQAYGPCVPTVAEGPASSYADAASARAAFMRVDEAGEVEAVLEDVAWLRYEGDEESVVRKHRAYFEQGYTTFVVTLRTRDFTQPTAEQFLLTDSQGTTLPGRPLTYAGTMGQEGERFAARFSLSFRHVITREVGWVRLKRLASGSEMVWTFPWGTPPPEGAPAAVAPPTNLLRRPAPSEPAPASPGLPAPEPVPVAPAPDVAPAATPAAAPAPSPVRAPRAQDGWTTPPPPRAPLPGPSVRRR